MGRRSREIFRRSASAAAELSPAMEEGHPSSITGFTSVVRVLVESVWLRCWVQKALLPTSEKTSVG